MLFAAVLVVLMLAVTGVYRLMNARTFQLAGQLTHRVETGEKVVAPDLRRRSRRTHP